MAPPTAKLAPELMRDCGKENHRRTLGRKRLWKTSSHEGKQKINVKRGGSSQFGTHGARRDGKESPRDKKGRHAHGSQMRKMRRRQSREGRAGTIPGQVQVQGMWTSTEHAVAAQRDGSAGPSASSSQRRWFTEQRTARLKKSPRWLLEINAARSRGRHFGAVRLDGTVYPNREIPGLAPALRDGCRPPRPQTRPPPLRATPLPRL
jgi:hypothetical protein